MLTDSTPSEETPLYPAIVREILEGLRGQTDRRDDALFNLEFYHGNFERFAPRRGGGRIEGTDFQRTSLLMRRAVDTLTDLLYKSGPARTLKRPEDVEGAAPDSDYEAATKWLACIYRRNHADAKMQEADRFSHISDVAAFQVETTSDPDCPICIRLWDASEFYVWCAPDDRCQPVAVATLDLYDEQRRLRLYTAASITEFRTLKLGPQQTTGGTAYTRYGPSVDNPLGFLPFSFFPFRIPTTDFWTPGPGSHFRESNDWVNKRLTDLFDSVRVNLDPILLLKNVPPGWPVPPAKPGQVWNLPSDGGGGSLVDKTTMPDAAYLQADPSFVAAGWDDLNSGVDHAMEMAGIAPAQVRMEQDQARSGASIAAEQIQPVKHAEGRQSVAAYAEDGLACLVLRAGAKHLGSQDFEGYARIGETLARVAVAPGLTLHWPSLFPRIPGVEQDQQDFANLDAKLTSRTQLLAERCKLTPEEAREKLRQIAEDLKFEQELFADIDEAAADASLKAAGRHPDQIKEVALATADDEQGDEQDPETKTDER